MEDFLKEELYREEVSQPQHNISAPASSFNFNISNRLSQQFVADTCGIKPTDALEVTCKQPEGMPLMTCRFCLRYQMGWCPRQHRVNSPYQEPYYLCSKDGRRFRLDFDCKKCEMKVFHA
jgi:putative protease